MASCKVKYEEGFIQVFGHIVTKPEFLWAQADRDLITPTGISYDTEFNSFYSYFYIKIIVYALDFRYKCKEKKKKVFQHVEKGELTW